MPCIIITWLIHAQPIWRSLQAKVVLPESKCTADSCQPYYKTLFVFSICTASEEWNHLNLASPSAPAFAVALGAVVVEGVQDLQARIVQPYPAADNRVLQCAFGLRKRIEEGTCSVNLSSEKRCSSMLLERRPDLAAQVYAEQMRTWMRSSLTTGRSLPS